MKTTLSSLDRWRPAMTNAQLRKELEARNKYPEVAPPESQVVDVTPEIDPQPKA